MPLEIQTYRKLLIIREQIIHITDYSREFFPIPVNPVEGCTPVDEQYTGSYIANC